MPLCDQFSVFSSRFSGSGLQLRVTASFTFSIFASVTDPAELTVKDPRDLFLRRHSKFRGFHTDHILVFLLREQEQTT